MGTWPCREIPQVNTRAWRHTIFGLIDFPFLVSEAVYRMRRGLRNRVAPSNTSPAETSASEAGSGTAENDASAEVGVCRSKLTGSEKLQSETLRVPAENSGAAVLPVNAWGPSKENSAA